MADMTDRAKDDFMAVAWAGFVQWAAKQPDILERFEAETGMSFRPPASGLEVMIDDATGYRNAVAERFVEWTTVEMWGLDEAPAAYRESLESRHDG